MNEVDKLVKQSRFYKQGQQILFQIGEEKKPTKDRLLAIVGIMCALSASKSVDLFDLVMGGNDLSEQDKRLLVDLILLFEQRCVEEPEFVIGVMDMLKADIENEKFKNFIGLEELFKKHEGESRRRISRGFK